MQFRQQIGFIPQPYCPALRALNRCEDVIVQSDAGRVATGILTHFPAIFFKERTVKDPILNACSMRA